MVFLFIHIEWSTRSNMKIWNFSWFSTWSLFLQQILWRHQNFYWGSKIWKIILSFRINSVSYKKYILMVKQKEYIHFEPSRWWPSGKSLGPRGLLPLWSQVRALWLLIWWPLEAYMVVNFRAREISRGARKLARTPTLN